MLFYKHNVTFTNIRLKGFISTKTFNLEKSTESVQLSSFIKDTNN